MDLTNIMGGGAIKQLTDTIKPSASKEAEGPGVGETLQAFGQIMANSLDKVNQLQVQAEKATETYAVGGPVELHQVLIATERAEMSLEMTMQIRNKMLAAYQEISHMSV